MAERLKLCSGVEAVAKLQRAGWSIPRQRGSHKNGLPIHFLVTLSAVIQ